MVCRYCGLETGTGVGHRSQTECIQALTIEINRAKELLRTGGDTVSQIAGQVGMDNVSHFIVTFKKREGVTPSVYRSNWYRR